MAESQLRPVIRHIRKLASLRPSREQTDRQLLGEFSAQRDEAAFAALVERHGRLVLSVCRHVLRHQQDAEDAFQATFLVLARKAASIRNREALASWLHGVAYRTAMKAKRDAARRRKHEGQVKATAPTTHHANPQAGDLAWREVQALFDEELQRLPEVYRAPFILCGLEGKSRAEAAEHLGVKEGTVSSRLARAQHQLQKRLARRGVALAAVLGVGFIQNAGAAAPLLVNATVKAALLFITGEVGVSAQAASLAEGAMKTMTLSKLKAGVTLVLGLSVFTAAAGLAAYQAIPSKPSEAAPDAPAKALEQNRETRAQPPPEPSPTRGERAERTDQFGDPLPPGAIARMGTMRLRHTHSPGTLTTAFSPDGKILASGGWNEIRLWDLATGKLRLEIRDGNRTKEYCALQFAPDGRWLAGAGRESVCIWDTATGRLLRELPASGETVACSKDGKLLAASASLNDGAVFVFDTATGKRTAELRQGHSERVHSATFTADGTGLVTMSGENRICHWDLAKGKLRKAIDMPIPPDHGLLLSPDGQTVAVTPREGPTSLWDTTTGKERLRLQGKLAHGGFGIAFSPDGKTLATNTTGPYSYDEQTTVALWDAKTGALLRQFRLPTCAVFSLHFAPDGRTLLTTGHEPVLRLWDTTTGKPALQWPAHTGEAQSLAFTPDGRSLVSGGLDGTVRLWEISTGRQVRELAGHRWRCDVVAVAPNGKTILSGGVDGCIRLQDLDGQQLRRILLDGPPEKLTKHGHNVFALAVGPDSKTAATLSSDMGALPPIYHVWDLTTGKGMSHHPNTPLVINDTHFSSDARLALERVPEEVPDMAPAAGAGKGGAPTYSGGPAPVTVLVREVATGKEILRLRQSDGLCGVHAFAPDGRTVLTVSSRQRVGDDGRSDNALHFWELATMKERLTIPCGTLGEWKSIQRAAFASDGRTLATARSWDGTIQLWDLLTGKELPRRFGSGIEANCLAFSPDSRLLASAHRDGTILVWDLSPRPPSRRGKREPPGQVQQWWADLAGDDARRAYAAIWELAAEPTPALRLFRERLRPAAELSPDKLRSLIADLDSSQFQRRDAAQKELRAYGEQAETPLRAALRDHPSAEQRRRIEQLLDGLHVVRSPELLRFVRAVEVLERIGGAEAHEILENLAKGAPDARLTKEAKASLNRLSKQSDAQP